jgi:hypothetical protein
MTVPNELERGRPVTERAMSANPYRSATSRHDDAVIQAELRRLAHALRPSGILRRED